nr:PREDICTED: uncharacterized protein LOC100880222 [Megachile rotundata]
MIFRFVLICLVLRFDVRAEDRFQRTSQDSDGARYCDFDEARKNYNVTDLLQCIDRLVADLVDRESDRWVSEGQWNGSTGRQISFMDIFSSFFENSGPHQNNPLPVYPTSGQYPSNHPSVSGGTFGISPGFKLNLFEALSTISRHDDYKCVPRILCEMASGKLPGRSIGKQLSGFFDFFGRNTIMGWLSNFDIEGASPLLNFGRAVLLGYSNRGNSAACYETFPKCPKDMNSLIYYLNNYNGGFFRLFNRVQGGNYRDDSNRYYTVLLFEFLSVTDNSKVIIKGRITSGIKKDNRIRPVGNQIYFPSIKYYEHYEKQEPSSYKEISSGNEIIFPNQKSPKNTLIINSLQNHDYKSESNVWHKNVAFFPQVIKGTR